MATEDKKDQPLLSPPPAIQPDREPDFSYLGRDEIPDEHIDQLVKALRHGNAEVAKQLKNPGSITPKTLMELEWLSGVLTEQVNHGDEYEQMGACSLSSIVTNRFLRCPWVFEKNGTLVLRVQSMTLFRRTWVVAAEEGKEGLLREYVVNLLIPVDEHLAGSLEDNKPLYEDRKRRIRNCFAYPASLPPSLYLKLQSLMVDFSSFSKDDMAAWAVYGYARNICRASPYWKEEIHA